MWVAIKPFNYRGKRYKVGDQVPAENWSIRRALETLRKIRLVSVEDSTPVTPATVPEVVDIAPVSAEPVNLKTMRRSELNTYAESIGLQDPASYANAELLLAAIEEFLTEDEDEADGSTDEFGDDEENNGSE